MASVATTSASAVSANNYHPANLDDPHNVRRWLQAYHPKQLALLNNFEICLRLGRFSTRGCDGTEGGSNAQQQRRQQASSSSKYQYGKERRVISTRTVELLRSIIGSTRWGTAAQLLTLLRGLGNELHAAGGYREPAIGNMVRRIMYAVRDESDRAPPVMANEGGSSSSDTRKVEVLTEQLATNNLRATRALSLSSVLWAHPQHITMKHSRQPSGSGDYGSDRMLAMTDSSDSVGGGVEGGELSPGAGTAASTSYYACYPSHYYIRRDDLRQSVMEAIQEIMSELEDLHKNINEQAVHHIHAGEIILTYALSKTVELFLKAAAAKKRKFQVIVCEGSPHFGGHAMAKSLAEAGIDTTVIHDAATFAIMARVNKVLLPAHAVLVSTLYVCVTWTSIEIPLSPALTLFLLLPSSLPPTRKKPGEWRANCTQRMQYGGACGETKLRTCRHRRGNVQAMSHVSA